MELFYKSVSHQHFSAILEVLAKREQLKQTLHLNKIHRFLWVRTLLDTLRIISAQLNNVKMSLRYEGK